MAILLNLVKYTTTLVTFETRQQRFYRAPFISEDDNFDLSTSRRHSWLAIAEWRRHSILTGRILYSPSLILYSSNQNYYYTPGLSDE